MAVPAAETMRVRGVPGAEDVTDGDVDYYGTDWINVENAATEEQMQKCFSEPCGGAAPPQGSEKHFCICSSVAAFSTLIQSVP